MKFLGPTVAPVDVNETDESVHAGVFAGFVEFIERFAVQELLFPLKLRVALKLATPPAEMVWEEGVTVRVCGFESVKIVWACEAEPLAVR